MLVSSLLPILLLLALPGAASPGAQVEAPEGFEAISRRAQAARDAGRAEEAIASYRSALALRPEWDQGWWYLGTVLYEAKRPVEAAAAFERFTALKPDAGPGWALRGLCAFDAGDHPAAIPFLQKGLALGLGGNAELLRVLVNRLALALVKTGQFELALAPLTILARLSVDSPGLVAATGLAILRMPMLPSEVPEARRDLVQKAGRAGSYDFADRGEDAGRAYAALVAAYPNEPWVHYAHGVFLLKSASDAGFAELRREIEIKPDNVMAHLELAFRLLDRGQNAEAREAAERAVEFAPSLFAGHAALGRALVELGELERGTRELEEAVRLAPESPETHFALARAYTRAGRAEDAARERATFAQLEREQREREQLEKPGLGSAPPPGEVRP